MVSKKVINYLNQAKSQILWMEDKMSENLKNVAIRSGKFKRFLDSCFILSETLELFIEEHLIDFLFWLEKTPQGEGEIVDSIDILNGKIYLITIKG